MLLSYFKWVAAKIGGLILAKLTPGGLEAKLLGWLLATIAAFSFPSVAAATGHGHGSHGHDVEVIPQHELASAHKTLPAKGCTDEEFKKWAESL